MLTRAANAAFLLLLLLEAILKPLRALRGADPWTTSTCGVEGILLEGAPDDVGLLVRLADDACHEDPLETLSEASWPPLVVLSAACCYSLLFALSLFYYRLRIDWCGLLLATALVLLLAFAWCWMLLLAA